VLSAEATAPGHPAHDYFTECYAWLRSVLTDAFERMASAGQLRAGVEPAAAARSTVAAMDGLQLQWLLDVGRHGHRPDRLLPVPRNREGLGGSDGRPIRGTSVIASHGQSISLARGPADTGRLFEARDEFGWQRAGQHLAVRAQCLAMLVPPRGREDEIDSPAVVDAVAPLYQAVPFQPVGKPG
jgi:BetI-type transcriptional repressor, C-terminal